MTWWETLEFTVAVSAALACFGRAAWLAFSKPPSDGCWLKPPGFLKKS